ncbi:MAG: hypothetical protein ACTSYL_08820 [Candidatus Thorarchaeota archaeon]
MQMPPDPTLTIGILAALISVFSAAYLIHIWYSFPNRLLTDLPLIFGVSLAFQGLNTLLQTLVLAGVFPNTLDFLRLRAVVIGFLVFPILPGLLNIWAFKYKQYHLRIIGAVVIYWYTILLFAPTAQILMAFLIPVMIGIMLGFIGTFAVTWRTGRLKEVRSDFMLVSLLIILASQMLRVPLYSIGMSVLSDVMNAVGTIIAALAFIIPSLSRAKMQQEESPPVSSVIV